MLLGKALGRGWRRLNEVTRPVEPELAAALTRRWQELPDHVKTSAQLLGSAHGGL